MSETVDDKLKHCITFILQQLRAHKERHSSEDNFSPLFVGLNGPQGVGKTTLASNIQKALGDLSHRIPTLVISLDDFYLTHAAQLLLSDRHPQNLLLQHRGQPSTHDLGLANSVFRSLKQNLTTAIPRYNKAAFDGQGDRLPREQWKKVNTSPENFIRIVIFEGWAVGFRALNDEDLRSMWERARELFVAEEEVALGTARRRNGLGQHTLENIRTINAALRDYDELTNQLDAFIHIDVLNISSVYTWRLEQEHHLASTSGSAMTDAQVRDFVDTYQSAYELYTNGVRHGVFTYKDDNNNSNCRQLRLIVDSDRRVVDILNF